jgi:hypothetical protein
MSFASVSNFLGALHSFYNDERSHMSIGNQTPSVAHTQSGPQQKMWRNPWENDDI